MNFPKFNDGRLHEVEDLPAPEPEYPFGESQVPDVAPKIYRRRYLVQRARYAPKIANRTLGVPDKDPVDTTAYLAGETKPEPISATHARVWRTFANIPGDQVSYDTDFFSRPILHDLVSGSCYAVSFDDITSHLYWDRKAVSSVNDPATTYLTTGNELAVLGHQQISITLNTGTSTFYLDDTDATIKDALSTAWTGDTSGAGFFYIGRWKYGIRITWAGASVTVRAINLTSTEIAIGANNVTFGTASSIGPVEIVTAQTVLTSVRTVNSTGHGGAAGNRVAFYNGSRIVGLSTVVAVVTDAFSILTKDLPDADVVVTHCVFDKDGFRVVNGPRDCSVRVTSKFYLPGVTTGITTGADVPQIATYPDAPGWLSRVIATTHTGVSATASTDRLGKTSHGLSTGDTFWLTALGGSTGLAVLTRYWAIRVDANNFKAAATAADAVAGTAIDITGDGTNLIAIVPDPWPVIEVSKLRAWLGPILTRDLSAIQMSDALETRPPTA